MIPIKMQLYEEQKSFFPAFSLFLNSSLNFEHFERKEDSCTFCICDITDSENVFR